MLGGRGGGVATHEHLPIIANNLREFVLCILPSSWLSRVGTRPRVVWNEAIRGQGLSGFGEPRIQDLKALFCYEREIWPPKILETKALFFFPCDTKKNSGLVSRIFGGHFARPRENRQWKTWIPAFSRRGKPRPGKGCKFPPLGARKPAAELELRDVASNSLKLVEHFLV